MFRDDLIDLGTTTHADEVRNLVRRLPTVATSPVLFYGSSSIRLWNTLERDFAPLTVLNHGFGGSTLAECVAAADLLVFPVNPRVIVLYAGDNDLDAGTSPETLAAHLDRFLNAVSRRLGPVPVLVLSVKPSPCRWWNADAIRRANLLLKATVERYAAAVWLDIFHPMLDPHGQPRTEWFGDDRLHLNEAGYAQWRRWVSDALAALGITA